MWTDNGGGHAARVSSVESESLDAVVLLGGGEREQQGRDDERDEGVGYHIIVINHNGVILRERRSQ